VLESAVEKIILDSLREVQRLGGHAWKKPAAEEPVIGCLDGFDSLTGIEATSFVKQKLTEKLKPSKPIDLKSHTVFVSADGRRALALHEVVTIICTALETHA